MNLCGETHLKKIVRLGYTQSGRDSSAGSPGRRQPRRRPQSPAVSSLRARNPTSATTITRCRPHPPDRISMWPPVPDGRRGGRRPSRRHSRPLTRRRAHPASGAQRNRLAGWHGPPRRYRHPRLARCCCPRRRTPAKRTTTQRRTARLWGSPRARIGTHPASGHPSDRAATTQRSLNASSCCSLENGGQRGEGVVACVGGEGPGEGPEDQ